MRRRLVRWHLGPDQLLRNLPRELREKVMRPNQATSTATTRSIRIVTSSSAAASADHSGTVGAQDRAHWQAQGRVPGSVLKEENPEPKLPTCCLIDTQTLPNQIKQYNSAARWWERYKCFLCVPKSNFKNERLLRAVALPTSGNGNVKKHHTAY